MHYFLSLPEKASAEPTLLFLGSHNFLRQIPTPPPRILHSHADTVEFLYFRDGKGVCTVGGKKYAVKKGDMVIYNANTLHLDNFGLVYFCGATNRQLSGFPPNPFFLSGTPRKYLPLPSGRHERNRGSQHLYRPGILPAPVPFLFQSDSLPD